MGTTESKPFDLTKPFYDQGTFAGRYQHFVSMTDPRTLFINPSELAVAKEKLKLYKEGKLPAGTTDLELWAARRTVEAVLHPDTGEPIPALARFSAFAPCNIFICSFMIMPGTIASVPRTVFIHWFNQSYNAAVNYANRNASSPIPQSVLAQAYAGAVGTSLAIALAATAVMRRAGKNATLVRATLPFLAVSAAGGANVCLIRRNELTEGVAVQDADGNVRGNSVAAGRIGLGKCCVARILWNLPTMVVPPLFMAALARIGPWKSNKRLLMGTEVAVVTACLFAGVPPALAAFPQFDSAKVEDLEPRFRGLTLKDGSPVKALYFNKGL
eukprot:TRINITY_DN41734_c0_g1_i1.p1 TRINITY_DN41734_c0_g1~~TRINITY_DN41734_c0_g1_i1.p1  ORF type:complete len:335 (+),score=50.19 TRINITY_DN41734_c0_g1_i1:22-1005(+)